MLKIFVTVKPYQFNYKIIIIGTTIYKMFINILQGVFTFIIMFDPKKYKKYPVCYVVSHFTDEINGNQR